MILIMLLLINIISRVLSSVIRLCLVGTRKSFRLLDGDRDVGRRAKIPIDGSP